MAAPPLVSAFARALLAAEPVVEQIVSRAGLVFGGDVPWLKAFAERYLRRFAGDTRPTQRDVVQFVLRDAGFRQARFDESRRLVVEHWLTNPSRMQPVGAAASWDVPRIESAAELAQWFNVTPEQLDWFADLEGLTHKSSRVQLRHYDYAVMGKDGGSVRLIEAPKPKLKGMQRQILAEILEKIPAHHVVHGFLKGRSIRTFAAPHVGQQVILKMDLKDFFLSISAARVQALFRTMGYPEWVAHGLAGICTNATPHEAWGEAPPGADKAAWRAAKDMYTRRHLPQGAPASPALANLCAYRVDCRLSGLAGAAGAAYTRYADDLAFSGGPEFERGAERFSTRAAAILMEEGFTVHFRKTRIMRPSVRQQLAGLVINERLNVRRDDFDRLKALLTNCARRGASTQNREGHPDFRAHLDGRIGYVEMISTVKGKRLRKIFDLIDFGS